MVSFYKITRIGKSIDIENQLMLTNGCGIGEWGLPGNGYKVSFGGNKNAKIRL